MINLRKEYLDELAEIFKAYCPAAEIWAYGSRVKGGSHSGSDLDLTVKSFGDSDKNIYDLRQLLNDSDIPFLIDINEFDKLPDYFKTEIQKAYVKIFN